MSDPMRTKTEQRQRHTDAVRQATPAVLEAAAERIKSVMRKPAGAPGRKRIPPPQPEF